MDVSAGRRHHSHTWRSPFILAPIGREQIAVVKTTVNMAEAVPPHPRQSQTEGGRAGPYVLTYICTYGVRGLAL